MISGDADSDGGRPDGVPVAAALDEMLASVGARACGVLEEAARTRVGLDSALLADGMTACGDRLRPYLGPADDELARDLQTMRSWGLQSLVLSLDVTAAEIEFGEKLVADYERVLGPGHPDAWEARRNLAHAYARGQRHDDAIDAFTRLRADMERVLGPDNAEVLGVREDLGRGYMNAGRYQEAVGEYTQLLADYERVLGPRNNLTLYMRGELGEAYLEVGRVAEGIELMEAAAAGSRRSLAPTTRTSPRTSPASARPSTAHAARKPASP